MSATPERIGRYRVDKVLGRGAMGVVYQAHDPDIDRLVAIKLVRTDLLDTEHRDDYLARFRQEVQAAGRCMHPNVIAIFDLGQHGGSPYFVMEHVEGVGLDQALPRGVGLGVEAATAVMLQVLDALACAHGLGVVHRDIKPANVLLGPNRRVKVMDFGISRLSTSHLTLAGSVMGTPSYMPPEQLRGDPVDARSDLFSAGVMLHELLTGTLPFTGRGVEEVMLKLVSADPAVLMTGDPRLPEPLRAVVARAIAKRPEDRFDSADAMAAALRQANAGETPAAAQTVVMAPRAADAGPAAPTTVMASSLAGAVGAGHDPVLLSTAERLLVRHLGPIAGRMIQQASRRTTTDAELVADLARSIEAPAERERFIKALRPATAGSTPSPAPTSAGTRGPAPAPSAATASALTPEDVEHVVRELTRHVGPIARVLVKRAAPSVRTTLELRERMAEHIERPADRNAFLTGR